VQLNITANDKENLDKIFSMILLEIQNLKGRLTEQEFVSIISESLEGQWGK